MKKWEVGQRADGTHLTTCNKSRATIRGAKVNKWSGQELKHHQDPGRLQSEGQGGLRSMKC